MNVRNVKKTHLRNYVHIFSMITKTKDETNYYFRQKKEMMDKLSDRHTDISIEQMCFEKCSMKYF